jgi:LmbE family N-acetylglucosaminyl deacetylase
MVVETGEDQRMKILAIFAHPDDEIGAGSTLAHYSDAGVHTVLVCASRGEAATIYCDECATRENLAEVRTRELACACEHLGVRELRWLDWPDSGIQGLSREQAIGQVVALVREIRPDVVLTHPENGLYPHPDHLAVWEFTRAAFEIAADPDAHPEAGAPWAAARLFTRAIPQSFFEAAPEFARYRVELRGQRLPFIGTPDNRIDVVMQVAPWVERRMAAWDCHRSQHNPEGAFSQMPEAVRRAMAENEHFVLASARVPLPKGAHDDLLAGLWPTATQDDAVAWNATTLKSELAACRAYLEICREYAIRSTESNFTELVRGLIEQEQEVLYLLAGGLRRAGMAPGSVAPDPALLARGLRAQRTRARIEFLLKAAIEAASRYRSFESNAVEGEPRALWANLSAPAEAQRKAVETFAGAVTPE